jgi:hypothetical protein
MRWLTCLILLHLVDSGSSVNSRDCKRIVTQAFKAYNGRDGCHSPICGALQAEADSLHVRFMEKLSPPCQEVMQRYRKDPSETLQHGFPQPPVRICPSSLHAIEHRVTILIAVYSFCHLVVMTLDLNSWLRCGKV